MYLTIRPNSEVMEMNNKVNAISIMHVQVVDERRRGLVSPHTVTMEAKQESTSVWSSAHNNDTGNTPEVQPNLAL